MFTQRDGDLLGSFFFSPPKGWSCSLKETQSSLFSVFLARELERVESQWREFVWVLLEAPISKVGRAVFTSPLRPGTVASNSKA